MSALETLLAGLPLAGQAGEAAEVLARLATTRAPELVSLWVCAGGSQARLKARATGPTRAFAESEPGAHVRDLAALNAMADRWGQAARSTGSTLWWARIGDTPRIGGAR